MADAPIPDAQPTLRLLDLFGSAPADSACALLDIPCHVQLAVWETWMGLGFFWQAVIVLSIVAVILGALRGLLQLVKDIAGWPGLVGVIGLVLALVFALLPKKPEGMVPRAGKAESRKPPRKVRGKRQFNPDTGMWEEP